MWSRKPFGEKILPSVLLSLYLHRRPRQQGCENQEVSEMEYRGECDWTLDALKPGYLTSDSEGAHKVVRWSHRRTANSKCVGRGWEHSKHTGAIGGWGRLASKGLFKWTVLPFLLLLDGNLGGWPRRFPAPHFHSTARPVRGGNSFIWLGWV